LIDVCSGQSEFFNINNLENLDISNNNCDWYLLFLPDFVMDTPFHFLLSHNCYELFHKISEKITKIDMFKFINSELFINQIIEMFIYIFECVSTYNKTSIEECYCHLSYEDDLNYIDEDIEKIEEFLFQINSKILESERFLNRIR
jgi:hypothetical protein